jgi:16S rRNA (guanine966-N2)-methyltransferase
VADGGRVITGRAKGLRLEAPGEGTRPLTDRLKQSLFAVLEASSDVAAGGSFLDLFAGSGAGGVEALSRGAARAIFVERDARACRVIEANLQRSGLAGGTVVRDDVLRFLRRGSAPAGGPFDSCLLDPPYDLPVLDACLELLADPELDWLTAGALVAAKHFWRDAPSDEVGRLRVFRRVRTGETMLTFYEE